MKHIKCLKCPSKAYYNGFCRKHFIEQVESRVKREIREKGLIKKDDVLAVDGPLARLFLKKVMGGMPLRFAKSPGKNRNAKTVLLWTMDDEILSFLDGFFGNNGTISAANPAEIRPFRAVKEDEMIAYAKLVKMKSRKKKRDAKEEEIKKALENLEKKHLETKFSLLKSVEEIKLLN